MTLLDADWLTPTGWQRGHLHLQDGRIAALDAQPIAASEAGAGGRLRGLPGFIDTHVHGGGGRDSMEGAEALDVLTRLHARHGTTALLATTMTAPLAEIEAALRAFAPACAARRPGTARVLGVHLEGPYLNPERLGAQPDHILPAALAEVQRLHALAPIRVLTLAPELPGHLALIGPLRELGIRVQIGHSSADYDTGCAALAAGAAGFTHLFNAMTPLHHRAPGLVGAALAHAQHAELIPDLLHIHPGAMRAAFRAIPGLFCVTDATAAAGMPDGDYQLGGQPVRLCQGGVRLPDGTLAGSALTMDQALRHLVQIGLPLEDAARRVSTLAAEFLGLPDRGRIVPGALADLVLLDGDLQVRHVVVEGEAVDVHANA